MLLWLQSTLTWLTERVGVGLRSATGDRLCLCIRPCPGAKSSVNCWSYVVVDPRRPYGRRTIASGRGSLDQVLQECALVARANYLSDRIMQQATTAHNTQRKAQVSGR